MKYTINFICSIVFVTVAGSKDKVYNYVEKRAYDYDLYENVLDPELCAEHLQQMNAFEFYDASFRIPQGILRGNFFSLGQYHQCHGINQPAEEGLIRGKYCLIQTQSLRIPILTGDSWPANVTWVDMRNSWSKHNLEKYQNVQREISALNSEEISSTSIIDIVNAIPMTLALCIPRTCAVDDVLSPLANNQFIEFNYTENYCRLPDDKPYSGADIAAVVVFSILGFLTLLSTGYELHHIFIKKASTKADELWSCCSVYRNTERLLTLGSQPGALDCLDGIRSLSILWVIIGHTFMVYFGEYLSNILDYIEWAANTRSSFLLAANVSVDTFFLLSGLLLVYTSAKKMKQMQLVKNLHLFYLNRLLRMFPLLAAAVLLQASVFHQVSDGVRWNRVAWETQKCRDYWWSALLHIQNIANPREICLSHAWYLSVDVQLHILSPLVLFWVLGSRLSAWAGLVTGVLGSISLVTVYCFLKQFTGVHDVDYVVYFYHNTFARSPPFIMGMLCGYMLHRSRGKKIKMHWLVLCTGHAIALVLSGYCMYHVHIDFSTQLGVTLNTALMRSAWGAALGWLILTCVNGYMGPINWFLSIKLWKFIARISYAMYLFHYPLQFVASGADITPVYFSMESGFLYFASDVMYTVIVSVAACVLIDAPCSTLIQRLLKFIAPVRPAVAPTKELKEDGHETNTANKYEIETEKEPEQKNE